MIEIENLLFLHMYSEKGTEKVEHVGSSRRDGKGFVSRSKQWISIQVSYNHIEVEPSLVYHGIWVET